MTSFSIRTPSHPGTVINASQLQGLPINTNLGLGIGSGNTLTWNGTSWTYGSGGGGSGTGVTGFTGSTGYRV
jgi:hypothetical protein